MSTQRGHGLTPLEIASGLVFGVEPAHHESPAAAAAAPLRVLEGAIMPALARSPCVVSFSGGRDSSCILALAVHLARREGLPLPVPATLRFPGIEEADESGWQDRIVSHLGLDDWTVVDVGDDLDAVGSVATRVLRRHGLLWPFNTYVHLPLVEVARGGSLLTGFGGDELMENMATDRVHELLSGRVRPVPRDILRAGLAWAPWRVRRAVLRRRAAHRLSWLRPQAQLALDREWATEAACEPRRLAARGDWWARKRSLRVAAHSLGLLATEEDVLIAHPLAEPALGAAILQDRRLAFADRASRLRLVFGDLLPSEVYERTTKGSFNRAFFGPAARAHVAGWNGEGVDSAIVDSDRLREVWCKPVPDGRSYLLLQSVWCSGVTEASPRAPAQSRRAISTHADDEARAPAAKRARVELSDLSE